MASPTTVLEHLEQPVEVPAGDATLAGGLAIPDGATAVVAFAHGSGSSRHSPRNRFVAGILVEAGLGTLLIDLLTGAEERLDARTAGLRFDIPLLTRRVVATCDWLGVEPRTHDLAVGLFGASTGAAAALGAAAQRHRVRAVVSRGGRPDLAPDALPRVAAPTLLIVGGEDPPVIVLNQRALRAMTAPVELRIVAGASHLFEEPGTLKLVAELARDWFLTRI